MHQTGRSVGYTGGAGYVIWVRARGRGRRREGKRQTQQRTFRNQGDDGRPLGITLRTAAAAHLAVRWPAVQRPEEGHAWCVALISSSACLGLPPTSHLVLPAAEAGQARRRACWRVVYPLDAYPTRPPGPRIVTWQGKTRWDLASFASQTIRRRRRRTNADTKRVMLSGCSWLSTVWLAGWTPRVSTRKTRSLEGRALEPLGSRSKDPGAGHTSNRREAGNSTQS